MSPTPRTATSTAAFFLLLIAAVSSAAAQSTDPTCRTGLHRKGACCPSICGQCGGSSCFQNSQTFNTRCCPGAIVNDNSIPSCNDALPPCRVADDVTPASGRSSTDGQWRIAPLDPDSPDLVQRHEACAVMVNGEVVLVGGRGVNKETSIYNPVTKKWRTASGPGKGEQIHHFQCVAIGDSIWIPTSWKAFYPNEINNEYVFEYRVSTDSWHKHPGLPAARNRGGAAAVRRGNLIFTVAGNQGGHGSHAQSLPYVDAFNWKTKKWISKKFPDMPDAGRDHVGGAMVNGELCIAGGRDGGTDKFFKANIATAYCYNFTAKAWRQIPDMPSPRAGANTGRSCDGRMVVAGGEGDGQAYERVDVFDGTSWSEGPKLLDSRHSSGIAFARCKKCAHVFIPSGSGGQGGGSELFTTEEYIPAGSPLNCSRY